MAEEPLTEITFKVRKAARLGSVVEEAYGYPMASELFLVSDCRKMLFFSENVHV